MRQFLSGRSEDLNGSICPTEMQMEKRLAILGDNERELDDMVLRDAEAFLDTKIALEESIKVVSDQIQYLDSVQQVRN